MPLSHGGLAKLAEECGELTQIAAKKIAYPDTDAHPDGRSMKERLEEEIADVLAACKVVEKLHGLNSRRISLRAIEKAVLFMKWSGEA